MIVWVSVVLKKTDNVIDDSAASVGSISAALSSLIFVPPREESFRGRSVGSFPEQRMIIEPTASAKAVRNSSLEAPFPRATT